MKTFLLLLCALSIASPARAGVNYEDLIKLSEDENTRGKREGIDYVVGGALGLGLSVGLGISTHEALPKVGYSLIQVLSATSIAHGASLYYQGNGLTQEGERLKVFSRELERAGIPVAERKKILDAATTELVRQEVARYRELRKIRGYLELTSAAASGVTLGLSKSKSSASSTALGFIILISLVGAYADLLGPSDTASMNDLYSFQIKPAPGYLEVGWGMAF
jgi:hypothetical protein